MKSSLVVLVIPNMCAVFSNSKISILIKSSKNVPYFIPEQIYIKFMNNLHKIYID